MRHRRIAGALTALVAVSGLILTSCGTDNDGSSKPSRVPNKTNTQTPSQHQTKKEASPQGGRKETSERKDLLSFKLDDRSQAGITDIWVTWTIKNTSSEKSTYSWDWEAVDASGTRLTNGSQLETNVQPGQTAKGEYPTTLKTTKGIKLNVTDFNRTKAY